MYRIIFWHNKTLRFFFKRKKKFKKTFIYNSQFFKNFRNQKAIFECVKIPIIHMN